MPAHVNRVERDDAQDSQWRSRCRAKKEQQSTQKRRDGGKARAEWSGASACMALPGTRQT